MESLRYPRDIAIPGATQPQATMRNCVSEKKRSCCRVGGEIDSGLSLREPRSDDERSLCPQYVLLHLAAVEMEERHRRVVTQRARGQPAVEFGEDVLGHVVRIGERF